MSEIRVNNIQGHDGTISFTGITTFSGTGSFGLPGGDILKRPEVPKEGQIRYINGDVKKGLEYYNGTEWITVGVANGSVPEGTTPIGVFGGGITPTAVNIIDYIAITSLGNATDFGDLTLGRWGVGACSSSTRGIFGGGQTPTNVNTIDYITITTTGNATDFGDLTEIKSGIAACSSSTRGVFGGGRTPIALNTIEYITIATTGNAQDFGDLTSPRLFLSACSSSTRGVFGGGAGLDIAPYAISNIIDYITIATTGNATDFGDLTVNEQRGYFSGCSSSTRGVFGGGYQSPSKVYMNVIDYITIATIGNATDFGDLTVQRYGTGSCSSSTRGVWGGGEGGAGILNTIDYITIATTGNASDFGDMTTGRAYAATLSNSHGGLLTS